MTEPQPRVEDAAAIERRGGSQVEQSEHDVDPAEPCNGCDEQRGNPEPEGNAARKEGNAIRDARSRSRECDRELVAACLGLVLDRGDAAEEPQGDVTHTNAAAQCDQ